MNIDELKTKLSEAKRFTSTVDSFIENNTAFIKKHDVRLTGFNTIVISSRDYSTVKQILRYMRKATGDQFKLINSFYSGSMIFVWESGFFNVWYYCDPDKIPAELMPSDNCEVIEYEEQAQKSYRISCKVGEK